MLVMANICFFTSEKTFPEAPCSCYGTHCMPPKRQEHTSHLGSPAIEDYLEQIHNLIAGKGYARVVDIAQNLDISQASVTNMIQKLDAEGFVVYERYRGVVLTE